MQANRRYLVGNFTNRGLAGFQVAMAIQALTKRLQAERRPLTDKEKLVLRLNEQYPLDVGVLSAFFLNYVTLKPGQVDRFRCPLALIDFLKVKDIQKLHLFALYSVHIKKDEVSKTLWSWNLIRAVSN